MKESDINLKVSPHSTSLCSNSVLKKYLTLWKQLNSCNSDSCNSRNHLNRRNCLVPSGFTSKTLKESSYNSKFYNSKNHLNRTDHFVPWTIFYHAIRILISKIRFHFFPGVMSRLAESRRYHVRVFYFRMFLSLSAVFKFDYFEY